MFKHPHRLIAASLLMFHPVAAQAQDEPIVTLSRGEAMELEVFHNYVMEKRRDDKCARFGCLIVINETREFTMIGMYLDTAFMRGGEPVWSKNMLYSPGLAPMSATMFPTAFKREEACAIPARFEFRDRARRRTATVRTKVSLCQRPGQPFVRLRVRMTPGGRVILENGATP